MYAFLFCLSGDERAGERKDVFVQLASLSLSLTLTHNIQLPVWRRETHYEHENTKSPFEQKDKKMASYVPYILVSNQKGKQKTLCRLVYY